MTPLHAARADTRGQPQDTERPEPGLPAPRAARLVIVEDGANVHELEPPPDGCEHTVVVVQSRGERPSAFAQRVRRRLRSMREEQQGVVWAQFLLAARYDAEAQAARVEIARLLNRNAQTLPTKSCVLALHAPAARRNVLPERWHPSLSGRSHVATRSQAAANRRHNA